MLEDNFDFYIVYMQNYCNNVYYPPYTSNIAIFRSKEKAIEYAKDCFRKDKELEQQIKKRTGNEYKIENIYFVEGEYYNDTDILNQKATQTQVFMIKKNDLS